MGTLHLLAFPPGRTDLLAQLATCLGPHDSVLLLEAGAAMAGPGAVADAARATWQALPCHVLADDVRALGIQPVDGIAQVDWETVIALTEQAQRCLSWWP